jgi:PadR family transcriptional regulator, regulatory protein AphA
MMRQVKSAVIFVSRIVTAANVLCRLYISTQYNKSIYTMHMRSKKTTAATDKDVVRPALAVSVNLRQTREKASRFAILGMLALGKKKSGYDLKKAIATSTANFWSESYGNIYPTLRKLLAEGAIQEGSEKALANKRQKQLYSITERGSQALAEWLRQPVATRSEDNELLLKLFFGSMMSLGESQALVKAHRDHHVGLLKTFEAIERNISTGPASEDQKIYLRATLQYGQAVSRALVQWSDTTERALQTRSRRHPGAKG